MSYRPLGQFPQYFLDSGQLNAGGFVYTYENDLTTPKLTYSDEGLTVPNSNPILLDAAGRPASDVWGDGIFGMEIADADDVVYLTANDIQPDTGATQSIPALAEGFLTNDLTNLLWQAILQVPDPSGYTDYILSNDGANPLWIPQPEIEIPEPDIVITTSPNRTIRIGNSDSTTKVLIQTGTATAPTSGARTTSIAVDLPTPYAAIWHFGVTQNVASVGAFGIGATQAVTGYTAGSAATSVTVTFNSADDGGGSGFTFVNTVPFTWWAIGTVTVA
jgi:hypothetical protein